MNPNVLLPSVSIACAIEGPPSEIDIQWRHNNGTYNVNNTNGRHRVNVTQGLTFITINSVSYQDNGTYYCNVKISGSGFDHWMFDKVDLILYGKINVEYMKCNLIIMSSQHENFTKLQEVYTILFLLYSSPHAR